VIVVDPAATAVPQPVPLAVPVVPESPVDVAGAEELVVTPAGAEVTAAGVPAAPHPARRKAPATPAGAHRGLRDRRSDRLLRMSCSQ
jgi:hypothetical protein